MTCSEPPLKLRGIRRCGREIGARQLRPFCRRARMGGGEMSDRQARAQHGTADPIEQKEAAGRIVIELDGQLLPNRLAAPPSSQPFAFQMQERDLV